MEQFLFNLVLAASGPVAYGLVFGVLVACGLGFPLPEDVALMAGGFLASKGQANLTIMMVVGFAGIIAGDSLVFLLGRKGRVARGRFTTGLLARHLTVERIAKVEAQFEKRGAIMVMIARFLPGVRAATYFVAGGARMSFGRFVLFDGIAALLSAPLFVLIGHHYGKKVVEWAEQFHKWLIGAIIVVVLLLVARAAFNALRRRKAVPVPAAPPSETLSLRAAPTATKDDRVVAASDEGRATG